MLNDNRTAQFVKANQARIHRQHCDQTESAGEGKGSTFSVRLPAEGSPQALKAGTKLIVGIKAAEVGERSTEVMAKPAEKAAEAAEKPPTKRGGSSAAPPSPEKPNRRRSAQSGNG